MMRRLLKGFLGICASLAMVAATTTPAFASTDYTYSVRFLVGSQGVFNKAGVTVYDDNGVASNPNVSMSADNSLITVSGLEFGDRITFDLGSVDVSDGSKYYVKGIRESGMDNNTISTNSFQVNRDIDYVVGYALLADAVAYTIEYYDNKGNQLAPTEKHYGNVGDRPVVAFLFIDGYLPQAYNLTGTLYKNPAENVFRFVYTPLSELPYIYTGYNDLGYTDLGTTGEGGVIVIGGDGEGGGQGGGQGGGGQGGDQNADNGNGGNETINDENSATGPAEILDIRDEESALSNGEGIFDGLMEDLGINTESPSAFFTSIPMGAKIGIIGGLAAVIGVAAYFLFIRRSIKNKKDEK